MTNDDILIRLRYALDLKNTEMVEIFKLGGINLSKEEVLDILTKQKVSDDDFDDEPETAKCNNRMLESFLNGFIVFKRGKQEPKSGQPEQPAFTLKNNSNVNNVMLKKVKIALSLTSEDIISILEEAGVSITKSELSALLRKEGHKNYKECGDRYARNFLKGLALKYRS